MLKNMSVRGHGVGLKGIVAILFVALVLSINFGGVLAQESTPEPSVADPVWRAFRAVRDVLEEEFSTDLTYVQSYAYEQNIWLDSIDSCDSEIFENDYREYYTGWTFRIVALNGAQYQSRVSFDLDAVTICDEFSDSGSELTVDAAPDPSLPAPVAGSGAAGSFELGGHILGLGGDTVTAMRSAGMTWVKSQLRYSVGNGTGLAQDYISQADAQGFKILLGVVGEPSQMGDFDSYVTQFASFLGQVAALGPDAIEVWNEPNIGREWPTGTISGARYTQLLAAAYNAIKSVNPNIIVISGAPAPTGAEGIDPANIMNDDRFMAEMAAAGAGAYMDCVGLHYNEGVVSPSVSSGDPRDDYPTRYFNGMLGRASVFPNKPICWTELGFLTPEGFGQPLPAAFAWAQNVTVAQHAAYLAEAASRSAQSGRVRLMIVWNVNFTQYAGDPMGGFAIRRPDGTCPACSTLGAVMGG
ncbi:MAG: hypothetical protein RLP44_27075 [Aggregatilineales bacterium]